MNVWMGSAGLGLLTMNSSYSRDWLEIDSIRLSLCVLVVRSGQVYTWGHNSRGQLGTGDTQNRVSLQHEGYYSPFPI